MYSFRTLIALIGASVLATAMLIYFTPLKWIPVLEPGINDINATSFQERYMADPDRYIFIDVRPEAAYRALHAKGSISMPLHTLYDARHTLPKSGKEIVLICSGGRASGVGYSYLEHFGFFNLARIEGGIEQWILEGLPTEGTSATLGDVQAF